MSTIAVGVVDIQWVNCVYNYGEASKDVEMVVNHSNNFNSGGAGTMVIATVKCGYFKNTSSGTMQK